MWYCEEVRFSEHFERFRRHRADRADITVEMCERIKAEPMKTEDQDKGRTAFQGYVPEKDRYLKVIVEPDGEEIVTAHWDRGFRREVERKRREDQGAMKVVYWTDMDTMYVTFRDGVDGHESEEIAPGIVADFAKDGGLVGIEFYDAASEKVDLSKLEVEGLVPHSKTRA